MPKSVNAKVGTKAVRLSYAHLLKPYAADVSQEPKYSVMLMIPKTDKDTVARIKSAAQEVFMNNPAIFKDYEEYGDVFHLNDGDGKSPKGKRYGDECHGYWLLSASNKRKPKVLDKAQNEIIDEEEVYSGCWGKVGLTLYPYSVSGNTGIGVSLDLVIKTKDDEPLGGSVSVGNYFTDVDDDDDDI